MLTQLLIDPHYRTIDGFATLLDKDVTAFGHKCAERLGYSSEGHSSHEWSPVILQLLDAVHQLLLQYPAAFEFNQALLRHIAAQLYAGVVGDFTADSESARYKAGVQQKWPSLWQTITEKRSSFLNRAFEAWPLTRGVLIPACSLQRLRVWDLFLPPVALAATQLLQDIGWCHAQTTFRAEGVDESRPNAEPRCRAQVVNTSTYRDSRGSEFTLYHIYVEAIVDDGFGEMEGGEEEPPPPVPKRVEARHRFSDFQTLDASVRASVAYASLSPSAAASLPSLPTSITPGGVFFRMSESLVKSRMEALNK